MAEKIEMFAGWDWDGSAIVGRERNIHIDKECTVVVHDGKAERVFTESEVRALAKRLRDQMYDDFKSGLLYDFDTYFDSQVVAFFSDPA
jgi:hypothetical protein